MAKRNQSKVASYLYVLSLQFGYDMGVVCGVSLNLFRLLLQPRLHLFLLGYELVDLLELHTTISDED